MSIEKSIIEKAKLYAKNSGRSLSDLIESYLSRLVSTDIDREEEVPEEFREIYGCITFPPDMNEKEAIRDIIWEKYSK